MSLTVKSGRSYKGVSVAKVMLLALENSENLTLKFCEN